MGHTSEQQDLELEDSSQLDLGPMNGRHLAGGGGSMGFGKSSVCISVLCAEDRQQL